MTIEKLEPITQRPIVRPEYTDPRGKALVFWRSENISALMGFKESVDKFDEVKWPVFVAIQYETELMRREMKE